MSYKISINEFVKYKTSTEKGKQRIIKNQKIPNPILIPWYQLAKARIKKYLANPIDISPITTGIEVLKDRKPTNKRQKSDYTISIEALERVAKLKLPKLLKDYPYEAFKSAEKTIEINNVIISINPELIVKAKIDGKIVYGGIKVYLSKTKPLKLEQAKLASALLYHFLSLNIAQEDEIVLPELCFSYDVFGGRMVSAEENLTEINENILTMCDEIRAKWDSSE